MLCFAKLDITKLVPYNCVKMCTVWARIPNMFGIRRVDGVRISNGVRILNGVRISNGRPFFLFFLV